MNRILGMLLVIFLMAVTADAAIKREESLLAQLGRVIA
jgi:hypothetical protein